ncbi:MAG TPA: DUF6429 family protein [Terriglobales bacterium]|nr:DUF6429 family protein [Terriglobales bacterium]
MANRPTVVLGTGSLQTDDKRLALMTPIPRIVASVVARSFPSTVFSPDCPLGRNISQRPWFRHLREEGVLRFSAMEYDNDKVDEVVLALIFLTMFEESEHGARAWKGHDWGALDRLHAKGYISDPRSKAKSVVVTAEGVKCSRELFAKHFAK